MLRERDYRPNVIKAAIEKARSLERSETLKKVEKSKDENDRVRFITAFNPRLPNIRRILKENHKVMLESDGRLMGAFNNPPMVSLALISGVKSGFLCLSIGVGTVAIKILQLAISLVLVV